MSIYEQVFAIKVDIYIEEKHTKMTKSIFIFLCIFLSPSLNGVLSVSKELFCGFFLKVGIVLFNFQQDVSLVRGILFQLGLGE